MKTLVIHPKDRSTAFLTRMYEHLNDVTVVTGGTTKDTVRHMVDDHDQVMMLGHGTPFGLMSVGQFKGAYGHVVDHSFRDALRRKDNSIFVWCNADEFVKWEKLKGFHTGMFISEVSEARWNRIMASQDEIDESNDTFARIVGEVHEAAPSDLHGAVKERYGKLAARSPVAKFNHERLYVT